MSVSGMSFNGGVVDKLLSAANCGDHKWLINAGARLVDSGGGHPH